MIKSDFGKVELRGNKVLITTELTSLIYTLLKEKFFTEEEMITIIEKGFETKEEIESSINEKFKDGISTAEMQELIVEIERARRSGLPRKKKAKVETVYEDENMKVSEAEINIKGKTKEEIKAEIEKTLEEILENEDFED